MRAIRIHETGGAETLRLETVPDPMPGPGEVLVRLEAIGVNFIEIYQRKGIYQLADARSCPARKGRARSRGRDAA